MNENTSSRRTARLSDGILRQNVVLMSGMCAGPVIGGATGILQASAICFMFTLVTFVTIVICRFLPKKIAFALRIVIYALTASLAYIPAMLLAREIFPETVLTNVSLYCAITVVNPLILSKTESRFFLRPMGQMLKDAAGFVIGFDLSCLLVGAIRDILTDNMLGSMIVALPFQVPAMGTVYGGFILVGVLAGLTRGIYNYARKKRVSRKAENG